MTDKDSAAITLLTVRAYRQFMKGYISFARTRKWAWPIIVVGVTITTLERWRLVMKALCLALITWSALISQSFAGSVTVADDSAALPGVAAAVTALLLDAGLEPDEEGDNIFIVEARRVHCDQYSNARLDASDARAGLPSVSCRIRSRNKKDTDRGRRFQDSRAIVDLLQKIQVSNGRSIHLTDCASGGYCGFFARSIKCTINTEVTDFNNGGRWSCTFDDGQ